MGALYVTHNLYVITLIGLFGVIGHKNLCYKKVGQNIVGF